MRSFQFSEASLVDLVSSNYIFYRGSICGLIRDAKGNTEIIFQSEKKARYRFYSRIPLLNILVDPFFKIWVYDS